MVGIQFPVFFTVTLQGFDPMYLNLDKKNNSSYHFRVAIWASTG